MEQENFMNPMEENKLPTALNVLTILTFIGSGIGLISSCYNFFAADKQVANMEDALTKMDKAPEFMKNMINQETLEMTKTMAANKFPILIFGLVGIILCVMGALQMRKLAMQGYYLWLIGEILPVIASVIFIGVGIFKGIAGIFLVIFLLVFIILYTVQRKHLKN